MSFEERDSFSFKTPGGCVFALFGWSKNETVPWASQRGQRAEFDPVSARMANSADIILRSQGLLKK